MTDVAVDWARVQTQVNPGDTTMVLDRIPGLLSAQPQSRLLVGALTDRWEYKPANPGMASGSSVVGLRPFNHIINPGELVAVLTPADKVKMSLLGGISGDSSLSAATRNRTLFNRFMDFNQFRDSTLKNAQNDTTKIALDGAYTVDDVCNISGAVSELTGWSGNYRMDGLVSHSSFPYNSGYTKNLLSIQNEFGVPNTFPSMSADISGYVSDIFLDGKQMANSIGCCWAPQQPGYMERVLLKGFYGPAAFYFGGQNCFYPEHIVGEDNYCTINAFQTIWTLWDITIRNPAQVGGVAYGVVVSGQVGTIVGGNILGMQPGTIGLQLFGAAHSIKSMHIDGYSGSGVGTYVDVNGAGFNEGGMPYQIDMTYDAAGPNVKVIRDVQRNFSLKDSDLYARSLQLSATLRYSADYRGTSAGGGVPNAA